MKRSRSAFQHNRKGAGVLGRLFLFKPFQNTFDALLSIYIGVRILNMKNKRCVHA